MKEEGVKSIHRFLANAIDFLFLLAITLILILPAIVALINTWVFANKLTSLALFLSSFVGGAVAALHVVFYLIFLPMSWNGQTLGKRFFRIKVVQNDGTPIKFRNMFVRTIASLVVIVLSLGLSLVVEVFNISLSKKHNSIFDVIASTKVVPVSLEEEN